jgi:hypothetical protein
VKERSRTSKLLVLLLSVSRFEDLFGTVQFYQLQPSFTNFITEQLSLRVGEVDGSVTGRPILASRDVNCLICHRNDVMMIFNYRSIVLYTIFIEK